MAATTQGNRMNNMNLAALQQRDPFITDIVETASQVALYSFSSATEKWVKTEIEGTLFVYRRSALPINGFMILNQLGLNNLIQPITKELEFQLHDPYLLYRNTKAIYAIWFYDKDECAMIGQQMNSLLQLEVGHRQSKVTNTTRPRRASESDSTLQEQFVESAPSPKDNRQVDILGLLSKAQHEYDKVQGKSTIGPKTMITSPVNGTTRYSPLLRPLPVRLSTSESPNTTLAGASGTSDQPTAISLEELFRKAGRGQQQHSPTDRQSRTSESEKEAATSSPKQPLHPMLQRLMSVSGAENNGALPHSDFQVTSESEKEVATSSPKQSLHPMLQRLMSVSGAENSGALPHSDRIGPSGDVTSNAVKSSLTLMNNTDKVPTSYLPNLSAPSPNTSFLNKLDPLHPNYSTVTTNHIPNHTTTAVDNNHTRTKHVVENLTNQPTEYTNQPTEYTNQPNVHTIDVTKPPPTYNRVSPISDPITFNNVSTNHLVTIPTTQYVQQPTTQSMPQYVQQATTQSTTQYVQQSTTQSTAPYTQQPTTQYIQQPTTQSTTQYNQQPTTHSTTQYIQQPTTQYIQQPSTYPTDPTTTHPTDYTTLSSSESDRSFTQLSPTSTSITTSLNSLLKPQDLQANVPSPTKKTFSPDCLLTPNVFLSTSRLSTPPTGSSTTETSTVKEVESPSVAALTRQQLQQALIYMLKNDNNFLSSIHEAYLRSLNAELNGLRH